MYAWRTSHNRVQGTVGFIRGHVTLSLFLGVKCVFIVIKCITNVLLVVSGFLNFLNCKCKCQTCRMYPSKPILTCVKAGDLKEKK